MTSAAIDQLLDELDALRSDPSSVDDETWDGLAEELTGIVFQRIENRSQLERLLTGMRNDHALIDRTHRVLAAHAYLERDSGIMSLVPIDLSDADLLVHTSAFVAAFADRLRTRKLDELGSWLVQLPVEVVTEPPSVFAAGFAVARGNPETLGTPSLTEAEWTKLQREEDAWPDSDIPGYESPVDPPPDPVQHERWWDCVWAAFDTPYDEPRPYLDAWITGGAGPSRLPAVTAVFELWIAGAALCIEPHRVAVVRGAAEPIASSGYSADSV